MTPKEIAERSAEAMWREDQASQWIGMELVEVDAGYAKMQLKVQRYHCNGHGICHGGISFALADSCFAFACNSYNNRCVGQHNMISYLRPIFQGETIIAEAVEINRSKNSGIYDITITNSKDQKFVEMRGFSRTVGDTLF